MKTIRIGTECSGIEAPIQALKKLGVKFDHIFSCEIDPIARKSILSNYKPKYLYTDITDIKSKKRLPEDTCIDMYVCGFPCQPFSSSGLRLGSSDSRSNIFEYCIKSIKDTKTTLFVLENVIGIMSINNGLYFEYIKEKLDSLKEYNIHFCKLNTKDYGIPQNRKRIYIVGILKNKIISEFKVPEHISCKDINSYIDKTVTVKDKYCDTYMNKYKLFKNGTFVNLGTIIPFQKSKINPKYSSTITASSDLWCIPLHRRATVKEHLALQGFPKNFKQVVSDSQLKKQIGNSMSVNVLEHLFTACFKCLGWTF
jgi:DNA (cytosine-5)-methyltransferase 1